MVKNTSFEFSESDNMWQLLLDDLSEYSDNWDAEGARAISPDTIVNCRKLLKATSKYNTLLDDIFTTTFGTVCIQWYKPSTDALVNAEIAIDRMAFYADEPGRDLYDFRPASYCTTAIDQLTTVLDSMIYSAKTTK